MSTHSITAKLAFAMHAQTPLIPHPSLPNLMLKLEGGSINYGHKFRSAAHLLAGEIASGRTIDHVADRSSGSWAMGLAWATAACGGRSTIVTIGEPQAYVRSFVEAHNGTFQVVASNSERLAALAVLQHGGAWVPDQHDNPSVIRAFSETLGVELVAQLVAKMRCVDILVAPVGTGGMLTGTALALRQNFGAVRTVGIDLMSSVVHEGPRTGSWSHAKVRGVGSDDEFCGTLRNASQYIDFLAVGNQFEALSGMFTFAKMFPATIGMSGGLALHHGETIARTNPSKSVVALLPDRGETYSAELKLAYAIFGIHGGDHPHA